MRPFNSDLVYAELDSLEGAVVHLREEIANRSDSATTSAYDLSRQLYESGLRVFIHCANHTSADTAATEVEVPAAPEFVAPPKHIGSRHASLRLLQYLWRRHIDRWLGPGLALGLMIALIISLGVLMFWEGIDTVKSPTTYP